MTTYTDYELSADGDRVIGSGDFSIVEDEIVIKQQMETSMMLSKKDWFLNFDEGIQYYNSDEQDDGILGARLITTAQEGQLQAAAENSLGVVVLNSFEFDLQTKELIVYIEALTEFGEVSVETTIGL